MHSVHALPDSHLLWGREWGSWEAVGGGGGRVCWGRWGGWVCAGRGGRAGGGRRELGGRPAGREVGCGYTRVRSSPLGAGPGWVLGGWGGGLGGPTHRQVQFYVLFKFRSAVGRVPLWAASGWRGREGGGREGGRVLSLGAGSWGWEWAVLCWGGVGGGVRVGGGRSGGRGGWVWAVWVWVLGRMWWSWAGCG